MNTSFDVAAPVTDLMNTSFDPNQRVVAFSGGFDGPKWFGNDQPIFFNVPYVNNGNHYDVSTGVFTCPSDGLYLFHMHARPSNLESVCEVNAQCKDLKRSNATLVVGTHCKQSRYFF